MRRHLKRVVLVLVVVVGIAACLYAMRPRHRLLLEQACRVENGWVADLSEYVWFSNHELLLTRPMGNGGKFRIVRYDLNSGRQTELASISLPGNLLDEELIVSPDRRWLLCTYDSLERRGNREWRHGRLCILSTQDGKVRFHKTYTVFASYMFKWTYWLKDSQRWLEFDPSKNKTFVHSLAAPQKAQVVSMPSDIGNVIGVSTLPQGHLLVQEILSARQGASILTLKDIRLHGGPPIVLSALPLHQMVPPIPHVSVSSQGDRLAIIDSVSRPTSPITHWFYRLFQQEKKANIKDYWTLSVSRLNGIGRREIGRFEKKGDKGEGLDFFSLTWLPDGKSVSFVWNKHLYVIPVD